MEIFLLDQSINFLAKTKIKYIFLLLLLKVVKIIQKNLKVKKIF